MPDEKIGSAYVEIEAKSNVKPGIAAAQQEVEQAAAQQTLTFQMGGGKSMAGPVRQVSPDVGKSLDLIRQKLGSAWDAPGADKQAMIMKQFAGTGIGFGEVNDIMQEQKRREAAATDDSTVQTKAEAAATKQATAELKKLSGEVKGAAKGIGLMFGSAGASIAGGGYAAMLGVANQGGFGQLQNAKLASPAAAWRAEQAERDRDAIKGRVAMPYLTEAARLDQKESVATAYLWSKKGREENPVRFFFDKLWEDTKYSVHKLVTGRAIGELFYGSLAEQGEKAGVKTMGAGGFKDMGQVFGGPQELWLAAAQAALSQPADQSMTTLTKSIDQLREALDKQYLLPFQREMLENQIKALGAQ